MFITLRLAGLAVAGAFVAAATAGTLAISWPWAVLLVLIVLLALAGLDVSRALAPERIALERDAPDVVSVGDEASVTLLLRHDDARPVRVEVRDAAPPSSDRSPRTARATIPVRGSAELTASFKAPLRGWLEFGPLTVRVTGPMGLAGKQRTREAPAKVKVYPALPGRRVVDDRLQIARSLQTGMHSSAFRGGGTNFDSLREYHPDDEFRRINWRATARSRGPVTNLFREERDQQVVLLMDASRMMAGSVGGTSRFDHAIDAGNAVAELAARVGDRVGMVAFADGVVASVPVRGGRTQARLILDALFNVQPSLAAAEYTDAFSSALRSSRRRSLLVLLTELTEQRAMERLFRAIPIVSRRHLLLVGSVMDPQLQADGAAKPQSPEEAYRKAAASSLLLARTDAAARLRHAGVGVEDRDPGELPGALVDLYLRLKGAGRL